MSRWKSAKFTWKDIGEIAESAASAVIYNYIYFFREEQADHFRNSKSVPRAGVKKAWGCQSIVGLWLLPKPQLIELDN